MITILNNPLILVLMSKPIINHIENIKLINFILDIKILKRGKWCLFFFQVLKIFLKIILCLIRKVQILVFLSFIEICNKI